MVNRTTALASALILLSLMAFLPQPLRAAASDSIPGGPIILRSQRALAPAAKLAAALGASLKWDAVANTLTLARGTTALALAPGSTVAYHNWLPVRLDVASDWHEGMLYVPVRWTAEALGFTVTWDGAAGSVRLAGPEPGQVVTAWPVAGAAGPGARGEAAGRLPRARSTWADLLAAIPAGYSLDPATGGFAESGGGPLPLAESDRIWSSLLATPQGRALLLTAATLAPATGLNPVTRITPAPRRVSEKVPGRSGLWADIYWPAASEPAGPGETVPGGAVTAARFMPALLHSPLAGAGRADPQLVNMADALARLGFAVVVPMREPPPPIGPGDIDDVAAALRMLLSKPGVATRPIRFICVSYGAGPCAATAAHPDWREQVPAIVTLGGYASLSNLVVLALTGVHPAAGDLDFEADPYVTGLIQEGMALAVFTDPEAFRIALATDPADLANRLRVMRGPARRWLDALSPAESLREWPGTLYAVHSTSDPYIPHVESELLVAALGQRGRLARVSIFSHARLTEHLPLTVLLARYGGDLLGVYDAALGIMQP